MLLHYIAYITKTKVCHSTEKKFTPHKKNPKL